jgi:hypothetical protein
MALTADQRAMLQLLLERGQSYDDIASLLGTDRDSVRERARAALAELAGRDPDAEVGLTDYLLGQADPIGRADAVRHLQNDPEAHELASGLVAQLQLIAPDADLPQLPKPRGGRAARRPAAAPAPSGAPAAATAGAAGGGVGAVADRFRTTLSERQRQVFIVLGALAVLLVAGILAIAGVFGGGDESSSESEPAASSPEGEEIVTVPLEAQGGGDASGEAVFGIATADTPYVDVSLSGLEPPQQGETYVVWLLLTPDQGYPLSPLLIEQDGTFSDRFPIPQFAIPIASRAQFVDISLSRNSALRPVLEQAVQKGTPILDFEGDRVLSGEIPATGGPAVEGNGGTGGGASGGGEGGS